MKKYKFEIENPERFKVSDTPNGGFRVDLGGMLTKGKQVSDTAKFLAMREVYDNLAGQGMSVEVRFNSQGTDGVWKPWPHLFGNPPKEDGASASDVADLKAEVAKLTALLAAGGIVQVPVTPAVETPAEETPI